MSEKLCHENAALKLCIDGAQNGHIFGRAYGLRLNTPLEFTDAGALLLQVERLMDSQNFPQAFQRIRTFTNKDPAFPPAVLPEDGMSQETVDAARGELATFQLYILTRQNATWQGTLEWPDRQEATDFTSDLEFLKLVEDRVAQLL